MKPSPPSPLGEAGEPGYSKPNIHQYQAPVAGSELSHNVKANSTDPARNHRANSNSTPASSNSKQSQNLLPSRIHRSNSFFSILNAFAGKSTTDDSEGQTLRSRPATQIGIPRSTSFFGTLSSFASKSSTSTSDAEKSSSRLARLPTPAGIPRSNSLFSDFNTFTGTSASNTSESDASQHIAAKRSRKISERLARTPFFSRPLERVPPSPQTPDRTRQASVKIEQRGLMKPVHPPLPRSSTMGNLSRVQELQSSPPSPSFMHSTSSSAAKQHVGHTVPSSSESRRASSRAYKQSSTPLPNTYPMRPSTPSKIPLPVKLSITPPMRVADMKHSDPARKTPIAQYDLPSSAAQRQIPASRLASRIFPTRRDSLPSASTSYNSRPAEEVPMDKPRMTGNSCKIDSERKPLVHGSNDGGIADTLPSVVGTFIDEDETAVSGPIDWAAHHRQRAEIISKRSNRLPSALKKSQSYREPANENDEPVNRPTKEEATSRHRRPSQVSKRTDDQSSTFGESDSYREPATTAKDFTSRAHKMTAIAPQPQLDSSSQKAGNLTSAQQESDTPRETANEAITELSSRVSSTNTVITSGNVNKHIPNSRMSKTNSFDIRMYSPSDSDTTITNEDGMVMSGIHYVVKNVPIPKTKPCPCRSGKKFKKCCMLAIRKEAEELYGDLDELAEKIGFICLDLGNSTSKFYAQADADAKEEARAKAEGHSKGKGKARAQEEDPEDKSDDQTLGGFNITYTTGGRPIPLNEPCPCGTEINFVECCMHGLNEEAEEDRGDELAMLQRQKRTVDLVLEILDPDRTESPEPPRAASEQSRKYTSQADLIAAHPGPGPESFTSRHVFHAMPLSVWLGRWIALHDHFRTTALPGPHLSLAESIAHPMNDEPRRNRRVFLHLRNYCMTEEAKESLNEFMNTIENRQQKMEEAATQPKGRIIKAKKGFFEKLKGKHGGEGNGR